MLSQVADRLYWFARYLERTENTARLILVRHQLVLDLPLSMQPEWHLLLDMIGADEESTGVPTAKSERKVISTIFSDQETPGSILSSIVFARENLRTTREVMPLEVWERINSLYLSVVRRSGKDLPRSARFKVLNNIIQTCQQINGMLLGTMNHDEGYQFVRLGRNIERADMCSRIIDVGSARLGDSEDIQPFSNIVWVSILRSLSAYQMYRLNMQANVNRQAVLTFLLKGHVFPKATAYCLSEMTQAMGNLPGGRKAVTMARKLESKMESLQVSELKGENLHEFIDTLQEDLALVHNLISDTWLHHSTSK